MPVSQSKLAQLTPNLGILWISVCSFRPYESIVANPIIYGLVPSPSRYEIKQYLMIFGYMRSLTVVHFLPAAILEDQGGPPTWQLHTRLYNFMQSISTKISTLGQRAHLKLLYSSSIMSQFVDFIHCMVFWFYFLLRDNAHTLLLYIMNPTCRVMYGSDLTIFHFDFQTC